MIPATTSRFVRDASLSVSQNFPAAGAANFTAAIDFGSAPGRLVDDFDMILEAPATPALADAHTITYTIKDSPDGVTFTAIPSLAQIVITGSGGAGGVVVSQRFKLPETVNEYVRADAAVAGSGGDSTALAYTLSVLN